MLKQLCVAVGTWLLTLLYHVAHGLGGTKQRVVCISRQSDKEPIDFLLIRSYVEKHHPGHHVVIMAKALDNPLAYLPHMLLQTWRIATCEAVVLDSYCIVVSLLRSTIQAPVVQIWHAMGNMKRFGYTALDEAEGRSSATARLMHMHEGYDSVVISSKSFINDYTAGFNVSPDIVFECPLPKADQLTDAQYREQRRQDIIDRYPQLALKKNIVYCPTFRKPPTEQDRRALQALAGSVDFGHYNLIYKRHPVSTLRFDDQRVFQEYDTSYDMLYVADYVVSDYSTVIYEAGLMDLPVYLYLYDWDSYSKRRGLYIDISTDVPAPKARDAKTLVGLIEKDAFDADAYGAFIDNNIRMPKVGSCTERLCEHIFELAESANPR